MNTITVKEMQEGYDWQHAFHEAMTSNCLPYSDEGEIGPVKFVNQVLACAPGENDGASWLAVVGWSGPEGLFAVMRAGCDYTGWDCQASGKMEFYNTAEEALHPNTLTEEERLRLGIID